MDFNNDTGIPCFRIVFFVHISVSIPKPDRTKLITVLLRKLYLILGKQPFGGIISPHWHGQNAILGFKDVLGLGTFSS